MFTMCDFLFTLQRLQNENSDLLGRISALEKVISSVFTRWRMIDTFSSGQSLLVLMVWVLSRSFGNCDMFYSWVPKVTRTNPFLHYPDTSFLIPSFSLSLSLLLSLASSLSLPPSLRLPPPPTLTRSVPL